MRWACVLLVILGAGCAKEEDWTVRPPGGGHGGVGGDDDGTSDVDAGGNSGALEGSLCVILDFENPDTCPSLSLANDVLVELEAVSTRTDNAGDFTLAVADVPVTVTVASEAADGLVSTLSYLPTVGTTRIDVPVVD